MRIGLTVGKFAPLHNGHIHLIDTALKEVDHLIIIVYDAPGVTGIPLSVRAGWIRDLYPDAQVIEGLDVPREIGYTMEIQMKHVDFIKRMIGKCKIDVFFSSEAYGDLLSRELKCENRVIDAGRQHISISGTEIRKDIRAYKDYIPEIVYKDLLKYNEG